MSRVIAGLDEILDGPREISATLEMHGQRRRDARLLIPVVVKQSLSDLPVQTHPTLTDDVIVERIPIERVAEAIARGQRAVGQFRFRQRADQPMHLVETGEPLFEIQVIDIQEMRQHCRPKLLAFDAGVLQRTLVVFLEGFQFRADQAAYALRGMHILIGERVRQRPVVGRLNDVSTFQ